MTISEVPAAKWEIFIRICVNFSRIYAEKFPEKEKTKDKSVPRKNTGKQSHTKGIKRKFTMTEYGVRIP
jgi:hypothetical protein